MREGIRANKFSPAFYILTAILVFNSTLAVAQRPPLVPINLSNFRIDFMNVGARPTALGGAFIGAAQDENAGPINPAGLTYLESVGASLHQRRSRFKFKEPERSSTNPDAKRNFHTSNFDQSMVSFFVPLKKLTFAIFRQVVFDSRFNFETRQFLTIEGRPLTIQETLGGLGNFPGKKVELDLEMVSNAFSCAFELSKRISIGITGKISVVNFKLNERTFLDPQVTNVQFLPNNSAETTYSITSIDERQTKKNFSVGLMGKLIVDKLFLGAVYNFNPSFNLNSTIFLPEYKIDSQTFPTELAENTTFKLSVPDTYGLGLYYIMASKRLRFTFDIVRIQYSDLLSGNDLNVVADDFNSQTGTYVDPDGQPDLTIDDATTFHFGLEYLYKSPRFGLIPLRFGIFTNPGHRIYAAGTNPDLKRLYPKAENRIHYTFGLGLVFNNLKFDSGINVSRDGFEFIASTSISIPF